MSCQAIWFTTNMTRVKCFSYLYKVKCQAGMGWFMQLQQDNHSHSVENNNYYLTSYLMICYNNLIIYQVRCQIQAKKLRGLFIMTPIKYGSVMLWIVI